MSIRKLMTAAFDAHLRVEIDDGDGEWQPATTLKQAMTIIDSVDESQVHIVGPSGKREWAFLIPELDADEQVVDYTANGWIEALLDPEE